MYAEKKRTACVCVANEAEKKETFKNNLHTKTEPEKLFFFPQNFILCYFRKSSHFTYVYIHLLVPSC